MAAWWQRLVAVVIDVFVLAIPISVVTNLIAGAALSNASTNPAHGGPRLEEAIGVAVVITLGYFSFLDGGRSGQTVGKMAMGIAVRDIDTGGPIGAGRALLRRFIFLATYFGLILFVLNALSPLWNRRRQAWHDRIVHSCVVSIR
jgi:uncharacterized RDD family membrane protein YckC